jgi:RNA polymerase sigma-70 factor (ECF subfamily)
LHNLVADYYRAQKSAPKALPPESAVALAADATRVDDDAFAGYWRTELLNRAWEELKHIQTRTRAPLYAALRLRVEHPKLSATELSQLLDRPVIPDTYRQTLRRARIKFAELLWLEVAFSLGTNQRGEVEQELADLELLAYCGPLKKKS